MFIQMPQSVKAAINKLNDSGFEAYMVGGCVRDSLLGKKPYDYDITTNALPDEVIKIFDGYPVIETGLKHGTVTAVIETMPIEITTYRIDGEYSDNRRPDSVEFTKSLKEDLSRRDFTINALSYNEKDGLVDYFGGQEDLKKGVIRCVGEPDRRFNEDALRILRALRFSSALGFEIDAATSHSIHQNKELLNNIAKERINAELTKLLCGTDAYRILLDYIDVIGVFIPEALPMRGFEQHNINHIYDVLTHTAKVVSNVPPEPVLRLAALLHDIGKPHTYTTDKKGVGHFYGHPKKSFEISGKILSDLKFDNNTKASVLTLILHHDENPPENEMDMKRWLNKFTEPVIRDLLKLKRADILSQNPRFIERLKAIDNAEKLIDKIVEENQCFTLKALDIDGSDLIKAGITDGKKIGDTLKYLLDEVIAGNIENKLDILRKSALNYNKSLK